MNVEYAPIQAVALRRDRGSSGGVDRDGANSEFNRQAVSMPRRRSGASAELGPANIDDTGDLSLQRFA
jgi:hypothetical protein